jgi:hypothetical protein
MVCHGGNGDIEDHLETKKHKAVTQAASAVPNIYYFSEFSG